MTPPVTDQAPTLCDVGVTVDLMMLIRLTADIPGVSAATTPETPVTKPAEYEVYPPSPGAPRVTLLGPQFVTDERAPEESVAAETIMFGD